MATPEQIAQFRIDINDVEVPYAYTDLQISELIDNLGYNKAAANVWARKAASFSEMVDITEAGSSRKNSSLFKNAQEMAKYWSALPGEDEPLPIGSYSTTRAIQRP